MNLKKIILEVTTLAALVYLYQTNQPYQMGFVYVVSKIVDLILIQQKDKSIRIAEEKIINEIIKERIVSIEERPELFNDEMKELGINRIDLISFQYWYEDVDGNAWVNVKEYEDSINKERYDDRK